MLDVAEAQRLHSPGTPPSRERRTGGRVCSTGTAVVHGSLAVRARVLDLAIGGVRLLVDEAAALPEVGAHVFLDVRLDGLGDWLNLSGVVTRVETGGSGATLVIELHVVPPEFEDLVQNELVSELECVRLPRILLVDGARGRRELVAAAFRAIGCHVIEVSSPLEAIAELDQSGLHLRAVVIADTKVTSHADELRGHLRELYPRVPLIDVGEHEATHHTENRPAESVPDLALQIFNLMGEPEQLGVA